MEVSADSAPSLLVTSGDGAESPQLRILNFQMSGRLLKETTWRTIFGQTDLFGEGKKPASSILFMPFG